jgi:hypothetical protein
MSNFWWRENYGLLSYEKLLFHGILLRDSFQFEHQFEHLFESKTEKSASLIST